MPIRSAQGNPRPYYPSPRLSAALDPPIPCEIIYAGEADKETQREIEEVRAYLLDQGFPATIDIANGRPVSTITRRMVADEIRMIAIGGFTRLRLFPAIFGEGVASELTKATLAAVFLLR